MRFLKRRLRFFKEEAIGDFLEIFKKGLLLKNGKKRKELMGLFLRAREDFS